MDATGRRNGNPPRRLPLGLTERGARGVDRRTRDHHRPVLGRRRHSRTAGQSPEFTPRSRRAASMRRIRDHRPHRVGARGDGDGAALSSGTRRRNSIRRAHDPHIDGECETRLAHHPRQLHMGAHPIRRSGRGVFSSHSYQCAVAWMEPAYGTSAAGYSLSASSFSGGGTSRSARDIQKDEA